MKNETNVKLTFANSCSNSPQNTFLSWQLHLASGHPRTSAMKSFWPPYSNTLSRNENNTHRFLSGTIKVLLIFKYNIHGPYSIISIFSIWLILVLDKLPMTGFKSGSSDVGSYHSVNSAIATATSARTK